MLLWTRRNHQSLCRIPLSVVREICEYFDNRRIVYLESSTLYFFSLERTQWSKRPLSIKVERRPPLLVVNNTVYLFACGNNSDSHIGNWTYRVNLEGQATRLANSVFRGLAGPAPLYDEDRGYFYLFGGEGGRQFADIQVYKPKGNFWCFIQAHLICGRSYFTAVKYTQKAFMIGGNEDQSLEMYHLRTGQVRIIYVNFDINSIQDCVTACRNLLVGYSYNHVLFLDLNTINYGTWVPKYRKRSPPRSGKKPASGP